MKRILISGVLGIVVGAAIGFFAGRRTVTFKEVVKYTEGKKYDVNFELPKPEAVSFSGDFKFADMVIPEGIVFPEDVDLRPTAYDWNLERKYTERIDNEYGKLTLNATVQYNVLQELNTSFVPIYKEITRYREKTWQPFLSASYSTFGYAGVGGGMFYRDWGVQLQYVTDWKRNGFSVGLMRKF
jgi:hypothetical protein